MSNKDAIRMMSEQVKSSLSLPDWTTVLATRPPPPTINLLFYADGAISFDGGFFGGLNQVIATLQADLYPWVRFAITTVHRGADPTADQNSLNLAQALALDDFDELWIYSVLDGPQLTASELAAVDTFMNARQGGVLITGDHNNLGAAFGNLPRAGKMRRLPAPPASPPFWNATIRPGDDTIYDETDQMDSIAQPLRWLEIGIPPTITPHPVLSSPLGPIDIFPDHEHEGEAVAPEPVSATEWPGGVGAQVIAWGSVLNRPSGTINREIGLLSTYDGHIVDVGRILADSTWHHHFDINLRGNGSPGRTGFVDPGTANWLPEARRIAYFFVNAAVWLAPPSKQSAMRAASMWSTVFTDMIAEAASDMDDPMIFGRAVYNALGRFAPLGHQAEFIWSLVPDTVQAEHLSRAQRYPAPPLHYYVAGQAARSLIEQFNIDLRSPKPVEPPDLEAMANVIDESVPMALTKLVEDEAAFNQRFVQALSKSARKRPGLAPTKPNRGTESNRTR